MDAAVDVVLRDADSPYAARLRFPQALRFEELRRRVSGIRCLPADCFTLTLRGKTLCDQTDIKLNDGDVLIISLVPINENDDDEDDHSDFDEKQLNHNPLAALINEEVEWRIGQCHRVHQHIEKAIQELRTQALAMRQPFKDDPHALRLWEEYTDHTEDAFVRSLKYKLSCPMKTPACNIPKSTCTSICLFAYHRPSTVHSKVAAIGIDFGCKNSRVAIINSLVPNVIASEIGNLMPSYVTVIKQSTFVPYVRGLQNLDNVGRRAAVGEIAKRQMLRHPSDVIFNTKKLVGKQFDDYHVQEMRKKVPFGIVEGPRGEAWVEVHGMKFSPVEITRAIFAKLKDIVQMNQFHHALKAVISVPAFFSVQQRKDIISAGNGAGFEVLQLIDEPTAAALSSTTVKEGVVVVFGMGAGSYSISILQMSGTKIETNFQFDDPSLGGDQFDGILLDYFVAEIMRLHSVDIRDDKHAIVRLVKEAEKTKVRLSTEPEVRVLIPCLTGSADGPLDLSITVSRAKFENLVSHLVEEIQVKCQNIVKDAKLTNKDIREIIIMGGMTRVPKIQRIISEVFGKVRSTRANPEEAVVTGSALQAALAIEDQHEMRTDVIPLSIGVESAKGVFMRIIPRHTTIPATRNIKIPAWCRECIRIRIFMGEHIRVEQNKFLGEIEVCNKRRPYQGPDTFELTFEVDKDNVLKVTVRNSDDQLDNASGLKKATKVFPIHGMICKSNVQDALLDWPMHVVGIHAHLRNLARLIMNTLNHVLSVRKDELPKDLCEDAVEALIDLRMALEDDVDFDRLKRKMHAAQSIESKMLRFE